MVNYKCIAKEYILVFIIAALQAFNVWADANGSEAYFNYYRRNQNGTFLLGQIDAAEAGVDLFSYKVSYNDNVISAVTGYYYKSDAIKFIDTIKNNKVVETEYFNKFDKTLYTRINTYRIDGFMNSVTITETLGEDSPDAVNKTWIFFEKDPFSLGYAYYAIYVWENAGQSSSIRIGDILSRYMVSEGSVNENYQPVLVTSKLFTRSKSLAGTTKDLFSIIITEGYARDANGNVGEYIVSVNRRISEWATSGVINGKTLKHVKNIGINGIDPDLNHLEVQDNGYEIHYVFTGDDFDENKPNSIIKKNYIKDDLYIERYLNQDTNEETGEFVIFCSDEQVRFKPGMETPVSTLDLSFDAFSDNALFMNHYTEYIKLPSRSIQY